MTTIAITCAYDEASDRALLHMGYVRSVAEAGGTPVLVYMDKPNYQLPKVDGLILSGGGDISPLLFNRKPTEKTGQVQYDRDLFELSVLEQAMDIPVLGICRGMQVLATAYGGNVCDHIDGHDLERHDRHDVAILEHSRLAPVIGRRIYEVNSLHHQAVTDVGYGMVVSALSEDGIIEAMEHEHKPHFGVQWHPEKLGDISSRKLFNFFVNLCKG